MDLIASLFSNCLEIPKSVVTVEEPFAEQCQGVQKISWTITMKPNKYNFVFHMQDDAFRSVIDEVQLQHEQLTQVFK